MFVLTISQSIVIFPPLQRVSNNNSHFDKITVTIFTMSGGGRVLGLGEALEHRVRSLVEGGELKRFKGTDGQTGEKTEEEDGVEVLVSDGEQSQVSSETWTAGMT